MLTFIWAGLAAAAPGDTATAGALEHATPPELAALLLAPADAAHVVGGRIHATPFFRGYTVAVWERSLPVAPTICRRRTHTRVYMDRAGAGLPDDPSVVLTAVEPAESLDSYGTTYPDAATPERCDGVVNYLGGPPRFAGRMISALTRLTEAMRAAASPGALPFELRCRTDTGERPCTNERVALASLPLDELWGVEFNPDHQAPPGAPPAPDEPATPTMRFGMSPPDGRSWFVTLIGDANRLREVVMWRTLVIYH